VRLEISRDPRLMPALGEAVDHVARHGGLDAEARESLRAASEEAARDTFDLVPGPEASIRVSVQAYADRIEVALEHSGEAVPTAGLDTFLTGGAQAAAAGSVTGLSLLARVDRVLYHTENGVSRTTLVKYRKPK
jgi:hypothetical protein